MVDNCDVLLIDDDSDFGELVSAVFRSNNVQVMHVLSGQEAVEAFEDCAPRVTIVDLDMADSRGTQWRFGGVDTVIDLREAFGSEPPIFVLTHHSDNPTIMDRCEQAGADAYFNKNESILTLVNAVRMAMAPHHH